MRGNAEKKNRNEERNKERNGDRSGIGGAIGKFRRLCARRGYTCDCCGREVFDYPAKRLCGECFSLLDFPTRTCPLCGRKTLADGLCAECKSRPPFFDRAFSPLAYGGETARLLNRMKNGDRFLAAFFASLLADRTEKFFAEEGENGDENGFPTEETGRECAGRGKERGLALSAYTLVPVPLTKEKERQRGYNQAFVLAEALAAELNGRIAAAANEKTSGGEEEELFLPRIATERALVKVRETLPQKEMTRREREANVAAAYRVATGHTVAGKKILLIDDLTTTGATGGECARILKKAGAERVIFLTAASAPERS